MNRNLFQLFQALAALPRPAQDAAAEFLQRLLYTSAKPQSLCRREISDLNKRFGDRDRTYVPVD